MAAAITPSHNQIRALKKERGRECPKKNVNSSKKGNSGEVLDGQTRSNPNPEIHLKGKEKNKPER